MFPRAPKNKRISVSTSRPLTHEEIVVLSRIEYRAYVIKIISAIIVILIGTCLIIKGIKYDGQILIEINQYGTVAFKKVMPGLVLSMLGVLILLTSGIRIKIKEK